ncbi:MAG: lysophospholipid acyltransferase family protein, partial [Moraxellaceae bacterium]
MQDSAAPPLLAKDRAYLALLRFFSRLPLPLLRRLGAGLGRLAALARNSRAVRTVARNLALCYPHQSADWREAMLQANFAHTGMVALEFAKTWGMPPAWSLGRIRRVHNEALFHAALANGRGTIAVIPHFGVWEVMNAW